jgi:hypothetical protein
MTFDCAEKLLSGISGVALIVFILWEGFETIVLPRRVTRRFRLTRFFFRRTWVPWANMVKATVSKPKQETWLSFFGPLSFLLLLSIWVIILVTGFALLFSAAGTTVLMGKGDGGFFTDLYLSGTTFFTLGIGDTVPRNMAGRILVVLESGMGFAFLALVIGYLPALNQSFSRREVSISLLDARAGSPPSASEMLRRHGHERGMEALRQLLHEWERWSAELLEGHLSYPVLAYFRSQHENQSWLASLTAILDTCALVLVGVEGACRWQAELTFAMARHALVDLSLIFRTSPIEAKHDRLPPEKLAELRSSLAEAGIIFREDEGGVQLDELRGMYEPYVQALGDYFRIAIPPWVAKDDALDNWRASSWEGRKIMGNPLERGRGEHF